MKRLFRFFLLFVLLLTGCAADIRETDTNPAPNRDAFTGRYVEVDITPPQSTGEISHLWLTDKGLVCCSGDDCYITADGGATWTQMDTGWMDVPDSDVDSFLFVEKNGTVWFQTTTPIDYQTQGNPYKPSLWKWEPDGAVTYVEIDEDMYSLEKVCPLPGERVLLQYYTLKTEMDSPDENAGAFLEKNVATFDAVSGELLYRVEYEPFDNQGVAHVSDGFIFFLNITGNGTADYSVKKFDPTDGSELDRYPNILPCDGFFFRNRVTGPVVVAYDNLFYVTQQRGISRVALGGSISEVILEYDRYSFQGKGRDVFDFTIDEDNTLYVISRSIVYDPTTPDRILQYIYDPDARYESGYHYSDEA